MSMTMRRCRVPLVAAVVVVAAAFPATVGYAASTDQAPTLVAESTLAGQPVPSLVQASPWQRMKHGWQSHIRSKTRPGERTTLHVQWRSPTFVLRRGTSFFRTSEQYVHQGTPDARIAFTDGFRVCFAKSRKCAPWLVAGGSGPQMLAYPPGTVSNESGWDPSPWLGRKTTVYVQWRFTWRQDNADDADLTLKVQL